MKFPSSLRLCFFGICLAGSASAQIAVYVSPNDIETAESSGILGVTPQQIFTENFNNVPLGAISGYKSSAIGVTYTNTGGGNVQPNDQYGGYNSGNYLGISPQTSTTLALDTPAQYFGLYFTAGDKFNNIDIYSANQLVLSFSTATLIDMLPNTSTGRITAINGTQYNTQDYYGQPVSHINSNEPYAYLHFITTGAMTFDKIVLTQGENAIFENDNHSILTVAPVIPPTLVVVPTNVPEASSALVTLSLITGSLLFSRRRTK